MSSLEDKWLAAKLAEGEQRRAAMAEAAAALRQRMKSWPALKRSDRTEVQADYDDARDAADWWLDVETHGRDHGVKED